MQFKNVSPFGDLYLTLIDRDVVFGEVFELPDHLGVQIVEQETNWEWLDRPAPVAKPKTVRAKKPTEGGDQ